MRRCCAEQQPFVFYRNETCYLFVQEGVFEAPARFSSHQYHKYVWALVDADETTSGIPEGLIARFTRLLTIYSTSPDRSRWARVHKTVDERVLVMNPWTRKEIHRAAPLRLTDPDLDLIDELFDELGPVPRLCIDFDEDKLEDYKKDLKKVLGNITIDNLEELADAGDSLQMNVISHKVCLIRRFNPTPLQFSS
ncbi:hypothetical protein PILCRDRAFT_822388 [Piloderma croceum F 1598]|uniref:Uncharacterized protein n=1 Tax=Piloderma croceum (strain F 1598) TaxID=765440 RepID=A0A0C3F7Q2_PILCF|nr:hypothetical protein PILCRDRAFT_822388 [Piloderma croceum F 1598]